MDAIRSLFGKSGGQKADSTWVSWTAPRPPASDPGPRDTTSLGTASREIPAPTPRPWNDLRRLGLLDGSASSTAAVAGATTGGTIGSLLTDRTRDELRNVLVSLDATGIRLAERREATFPSREQYRRMAPGAALEWIESQPAVFASSLSAYQESCAPAGVSSLSDVMLLDALHGPEGAAQAPLAGLADALRALDALGVGLTSRSGEAPMDTLEAYHRLGATPPEPVVVHSGSREWTALRPEDVTAIDFFTGSKTDRGLAMPRAATTLQSLEESGYRLSAFTDRGRFSPVDACGAYLAVGRSLPIVVQGPGGTTGFTVGPAELADLGLVQQRAQEVDQLFRDHVLPVLGDSHLQGPEEQARFFDAVYGTMGAMPREEACRRLATLTRATYFSAGPVMSEIVAAAATDGDVDGRIEDFARISGAGLPDSDRLPALRFLHGTMRDLSSDAVPYPVLHDLFLDVLAGARDLALAKAAAELSTLPVPGVGFEERAECMAEMSRAQGSAYRSTLLGDYLDVVNPPSPTASPAERARQVAATFAPMRRAFAHGLDTEATRRANEAARLVSLPVGDETLAQRIAVMESLVAHRLSDPITAYRTLLVRRVEGESLARTAERMGHLLTGLGALNAQDRALDVFCTLQEAFRKDSGLHRDEVIERFDEAIAISGDVERAIAAATAPTRNQGTITQDRETVSIGGIRLPRNRPTE